MNNDVGSATDSLFDRADALTAEFDSTTGHTHDGTAGNGGPIDASDLTGLNYFRAVRQFVVLSSGTSSTKNVTTEFTGKTPGGDATTLGVVTTPPKNKCYLINNTDGTAITDPQGDIVYARITESGGTWTLSYFTNEAGTETAYTFSSDTSMQVYYTEVFNLSTVPTFNEDSGLVETGNFTADIPDATTTVRGLVSTGAQTFGGAKTFNGSVRLREAVYLDETNNNQSGASVTLTNPALGIIRLINASLTSVEGIAAPSFNQVIAIFNTTGNDIVIENDSAATPADGIVTGTGADFDFLNGAAVLLIYDVTTDRWRMIGGGGGSGGGQFVTADFTGTTITLTGDGFQRFRYTGGSAQTISAITVTGAPDAARFVIQGTSDTNTITLNDNDVSNGWVLNGTWVGYRGSIIELQWDSTAQRLFEVCRSE